MLADNNTLPVAAAARKTTAALGNEHYRVDNTIIPSDLNLTSDLRKIEDHQSKLGQGGMLSFNHHHLNHLLLDSGQSNVLFPSPLNFTPPSHLDTLQTAYQNHQPSIAETRIVYEDIMKNIAASAAAAANNQSSQQLRPSTMIASMTSSGSLLQQSNKQVSAMLNSQNSLSGLIPLLPLPPCNSGAFDFDNVIGGQSNGLQQQSQLYFLSNNNQSASQSSYMPQSHMLTTATTTAATTPIMPPSFMSQQSNSLHSLSKQFIFNKYLEQSRANHLLDQSKTNVIGNYMINPTSSFDLSLNVPQHARQDSPFHHRSRQDVSVCGGSSSNLNSSGGAPQVSKRQSQAAQVVAYLIEDESSSLIESLEKQLLTCKRYIEAIRAIQTAIAAEQQHSALNEQPSKSLFGRLDRVQSSWAELKTTVKESMETIIFTLKRSLEDTIFTQHLAESAAELAAVKSKLTSSAKKNLDDTSFNQLLKLLSTSTKGVAIEAQRNLDVLINSQSLINLKTSLSESSVDLSFDILKDNSCTYFGYTLKAGCSNSSSSSCQQVAVAASATSSSSSSSLTKRTGRGILFLHEQGCVYEGYFYRDKPNGLGKLMFANGDVYEGQFLDGLQHGRGKFVSAISGDIYEGEYKKGKRSGNGCFTWNNGKSYNGSCMNDVPHGFGEYTDAIKTTQGHEVQSQPQSKSKENTSSKSLKEIYQGNWKNSKKDGQAILFIGVPTEWKDGRLIKVLLNDPDKELQ